MVKVKSRNATQWIKGKIAKMRRRRRFLPGFVGLPAAQGPRGHAALDRQTRQRFAQIGSKFGEVYDLLKEEAIRVCAEAGEEHDVITQLARMANVIIPRLATIKKKGLTGKEGIVFSAKLKLKEGKTINIIVAQTESGWKILREHEK